MKVRGWLLSDVSRRSLTISSCCRPTRSLTWSSKSETGTAECHQDQTRQTVLRGLTFPNIPIQLCTLLAIRSFQSLWFTLRLLWRCWKRGDWVSPQSSKVQMWVRRNFFHMFILVEGPMHLSFLLATTMQFVNILVDWNFRNTAILSKATGWQSERLRSFGFAPTFSINWKQKERLISAVCCVFAVLFVFF